MKPSCRQYYHDKDFGWKLRDFRDFIPDDISDENKEYLATLYSENLQRAPTFSPPSQEKECSLVFLEQNEDNAIRNILALTYNAIFQSSFSSEVGAGSKMFGIIEKNRSEVLAAGFWITDNKIFKKLQAGLRSFSDAPNLNPERTAIIDWIAANPFLPKGNLDNILATIKKHLKEQGYTHWLSETVLPALYAPYRKRGFQVFVPPEQGKKEHALLSQVQKDPFSISLPDGYSVVFRYAHLLKIKSQAVLVSPDPAYLLMNIDS